MICAKAKPIAIERQRTVFMMEHLVTDLSGNGQGAQRPRLC